jgi:hypothetical protein
MICLARKVRLGAKCSTSGCPSDAGNRFKAEFSVFLPDGPTPATQKFQKFESRHKSLS